MLVPRGLSLDAYQMLVSEAAGQPVGLAVCDAGQIVQPAQDGLPKSMRERLCAWLERGEPGVPGSVIEQPLNVPGMRGLRLVAVCQPASTGDAARMIRAAARALPQVARCVGHAWGLCLELDEMTEELTARYEELNLIYQLDKAGGDAGLANTAVLRAILDDAATHLAVPVVAVFAPDDDLELMAVRQEVSGSAQAAASLTLASERLRALASGHDGALVINRMDDARRDSALRALPAKLMVAPVRTGGSSTSVVAALRGADEPDFRTSDRKLVMVLADQIASFLRGARDDLTGLLNRRGFERRLAAHLESGRTDGGLLLHLDLHNFQVLNETCGRLAGDELLRQVADVLNSATRDSDSTGRVGSDEFCVLIDHCQPGTETRLAEGMLDRVRRHEFVWAGKSQQIDASIGAVLLAEVTDDAPRLLSLAESACELALESGINNCHVYSHNDEQVFEQRGHMQWVPRLRDALQNDSFELYAQPIRPVEPAAGRPLHQELLLRLRGEDGTLVPPNRFLPAAERFHLIHEIDRWVVQRALAVLSEHRWQVQARAAVWSINLSGQSLSDTRFHAFLIDAIERSRVPCRNLCFEVTETAAVANHRLAAELIGRLRALGVSFALDDFGAGLSSFSYLKSLPVDLLKIDGNFVKHLATDVFSRATVDAVNRVGKALGLATVAEYVENDAILAVLRELGVDYGQGYGLGRPQPLEQALSAMAVEAARSMGAHVIPMLHPDKIRA